ncbi:MAG: hypothetical protein ABWJ42_02665 [Sulfolobales archaeon]
MRESSDYECRHINRICREYCVEKSISREDYTVCFEECVRDYMKKCSSAER